MNQTTRGKLRNMVLNGRSVLECATKEELQGRFGIYCSDKSNSIIIEDESHMGHLNEEDLQLRKALVEHLDLLETDGQMTALDQFVRETAFTWLNRLVAFKMMEARGLLRETVSRLEDSNGFKMWLTEPGNEEYLAEYEKGDLPQNGRGEGPRQRAYKAFILDQCRRLSEEVRVLFDSDALVSRFLPQPRVLKELMNLLNDPELAEAWRPGNEETIGWVYQGFNEQEKKEVFYRLYKLKQKVQAADIPAATQIFTPSWIVRFLVENTLGRLWLDLHPDSELGTTFSYLVPLDQRQKTKDKEQDIKSVKEITLLDPACGTMHFGLVAFDLFVAMYLEEIKNVGKPGWPKTPPVKSEEEIPAAIIANNIHGIDVDLRAVQLSALTLYLKAKTMNPKAHLCKNHLACGNVHMLDGENLKEFVERTKFGPIYRRILTALQERLKDSEQLGSLLRLEGEIRELIEEERKRYEREGRTPDLFGWSKEIFETEAGRQDFWEMLEIQIGQALDEFVHEWAGSGLKQTFFAGETVKGLRLLELMGQRYDVVVTNPPYMTSRNMNSKLKKLVQNLYPFAKSDLYACFIQRCSEWLLKNGYLGMIAQQSFMFISSYEKLRRYLRDSLTINVVPHVGPRAFEEVTGEKVNTVLFVFRREDDPETRQNAVGIYFRLVKEPDSKAKQRRFEEAVANLRAGRDDPIVYHYRQGDFDAIPGSPWVYWITPGLRKMFETLPKLGEIAQPRQGLATAENFRFLRYWWEPDIDRIGFGCRNAVEAQNTGKRWFPYMKGGGFRKWYGNQAQVIAF
ncbi:MAG TPA: BREX-1 system adenine-specific DNA-methyltransferase PglX, partial [Desulfobulbaceae bacterium]|nr:BREX-1 system adenine-specific DNA-methyltransferase PglX [Desulfobulbaceae bacterium]